MRRTFTIFAGLLVAFFSVQALAESIEGSYIEARTISSARADRAPVGGEAGQVVLAWQVRQGSYGGEKLDGKTILAVVSAESSPGGSLGHTKTTFFIEEGTTASQSKALVRLAKDLAPAAIHDAGEVVKARVDVRIAEGCGCGAAVVECPVAKVRTRRPTDSELTLLGDGSGEKPLAEVFFSNRTVADQCSFGSQAVAGSAKVTAFSGSFSR